MCNCKIAAFSTFSFVFCKFYIFKYKFMKDLVS
jgi:hypothetical protein